MNNISTQVELKAHDSMCHACAILTSNFTSSFDLKQKMLGIFGSTNKAFEIIDHKIFIINKSLTLWC